MTIIEAIVLGVIQGIGEFLPISSSGHLLLVRWLWGGSLNTPEALKFDVALHMGTLFAILLVFWPEIVELAKGAFEGRRTNRGRLSWGIVMATVPAAVAGLLLEDYIETVFRSPLITATMLAFWGILLYYVDRLGRKEKEVDQVRFRDLLVIGLAQCMALVPGTSRSGSTMTGALFMGLSREAAARISFLLAAPITAGAGIMQLKDLTLADVTPAFIIGVVTSAVVGYIVIRFLLNYLRKGSFFVFAVYRVALAALIFGLFPFYNR